jgi:hypothetical protein
MKADGGVLSVESSDAPGEREPEDTPEDAAKCPSGMDGDTSVSSTPRSPAGGESPEEGTEEGEPLPTPIPPSICSSLLRRRFRESSLLPFPPDPTLHHAPASTLQGRRARAHKAGARAARAGGANGLVRARAELAPPLGHICCCQSLGPRHRTGSSGLYPFASASARVVEPPLSFNRFIAGGPATAIM